jgi:hypothetical protein
MLAGNVAFYSWPSLGCPSAIGWQEELVAAVGDCTERAVLHLWGFSHTLNCYCSPKEKDGDMICICSRRREESIAHERTLNFSNSLKVITHSLRISY